MERETGIEPATNSLEGCDSTTELLPHISQLGAAHSALRSRLSFEINHLRSALALRATAGQPSRVVRLATWPCATFASADGLAEARRWASEGWRGEDSNLRSPGTTDLQSAAFDRFATSPLCIPRDCR